MIELPKAESVNYWKTGHSGVERWSEKSQKQIERVGGEVREKGSVWQLGRAAVMICFQVGEDTFRVVWPVLETKDGRTDDPAALIQAATFMFHDIKAKCMTALIFGARRAFIGELVLPEHGRTVGELELPQLQERVPKLLMGPRKRRSHD